MSRSRRRPDSAFVGTSGAAFIQIGQMFYSFAGLSFAELADFIIKQLVDFIIIKN
jgi:hypothetical protein